MEPKQHQHYNKKRSTTKYRNRNISDTLKRVYQCVCWAHFSITRFQIIRKSITKYSDNFNELKWDRVGFDVWHFEWMIFRWKRQMNWISNRIRVTNGILSIFQFRCQFNTNDFIWIFIALNILYQFQSSMHRSIWTDCLVALAALMWHICSVFYSNLILYYWIELNVFVVEWGH